MYKRILFCMALCGSLLASTALADEIDINSQGTPPDDSTASQTFPEGYLPPDLFFAAAGDDYSVSVMAVQSSPNTPVTSASGLKGILIRLFGSYDPPIIQLRYQSNSSSSYTYVNEIQPDYPWIASAAIFGVLCWCIFGLGGALLRKT